jgi:ATP-dependent RNA helicase DDX21
MLRRSSSVFSRRFFAVLTSVERVASSSSSTVPLRNCVSGGGFRTFHVKSGPLYFQSLSVSCAAQYAIDHDYSRDHEVSSANGNEGLEIAKLGISPEIVDALAKKGILNLFPIQVSSLCCVFEFDFRFGF